MEVFIRQNAITLYIAFDSPDTTPFPYNTGQGIGPAFQVFLDTKHDGSTLPNTDDYLLTARKNGMVVEYLRHVTRQRSPLSLHLQHAGQRPAAGSLRQHQSLAAGETAGAAMTNGVNRLSCFADSLIR
jgi:hypothetical protein